MSQSAPPAISPALTERLRELRDALLVGLVERDVSVRLALVAALAGEHLLLLGPPGTAKSLVARRLRLAFADSTYFERLLTRFTVPEELFGPLSIKGLEDDRYERLIQSYLPSASIAFLDEIFKANSAILNALLTLLNEREFDNGAHRITTPLIAVIGASNELPEGEELDALFDRFLLRLHVGSVSKDAFPDLLGLRGDASPEVPERLRLTKADLEAVHSSAARVEVPDDVMALLCELRDWCAAEKMPVSDRRWRKIVKLLQVSALTNGRDKVSVWDCWLLQHCLWSVPEDRKKAHDWYSARVGATADMDPTHLTKVMTIWEGQLKRDQEDRSQARDEQGRALFLGTDGKSTINPSGPIQAKRDKERLFLAPVPASSHGSYHYESYRIHDRTNNGGGYTETELNELYVRQGTQFARWDQRSDYLLDVNNWLTTNGVLAPITEPTRHKAVYIEKCVADIETHRAGVIDYQNQLAKQVASLDQNIRTHLWVTADFIEPASASLARTTQVVERLLARVEQVKAGFQRLPVEATEPDASKSRKSKKS